MDTRFNKNKVVRNIVIFTVLVLGLALLAKSLEIPPEVLNDNPDASGLGQLLWIVSPLIVVILLRTFGGDGWKDLGLRPIFKGNALPWFISIFIFPLVLLLSILVGLLLGGLEIHSNMFDSFTSVIVTALLFNIIKNFFEEFAWRGYLAPKVYSLNLNIWLSHAIVGVIWGLWHLPFVYAFWLYLTPDMLWYFIPLLLMGTISQSVVYGEIRLKTESFLPAWVMHTVGNTVGNAFLLSGLIQLNPGKEVLFSPGAEGIVSIIFMFAIGLWLNRWRNKTQLERN